MKKAKYTIILALLLVLVFPVLSVFAEDEPVDWSTVDWATFDFSFFFGEGYAHYASLEQYLMTEADLQSVMEYARYVDGAFAESFDKVIRYRFMKTPEECLILLENEEEYVQKHVVLSIYYYVMDEDAPNEFVKVLENVRLDAQVHPQAVGFLKEIIEGTEKRLGISITNPQTGESFLWAPLGLLFSAAGLVFTKRKLAI